MFASILWIFFNCLSGLFFAYALKKAMIIWVNETKKKFVIMTMLSGIIISIFFLVVKFSNNVNVYGIIGIFAMFYHVCMLIIKLNRLQVAYILGHQKWSMILSISNFFVFLFQFYYGLSCNSSMIDFLDSLLAWEFQSRTVLFIQISGALAFVETILSVIIESSTCVFLRSTLLLGEAFIKWQHIGRFEVAVVLLGTLWFLFCSIGVTTEMFPIVYVYFGVLYFVFQSLISCSIVSSVGNFKHLALERRNEPSEQVLNNTRVN